MPTFVESTGDEFIHTPPLSPDEDDVVNWDPAPGRVLLQPIRAAMLHAALNVTTSREWRATVLSEHPPTHVLEASDDRGWRPIHHAIRGGSHHMVWYLVNQGVDLCCITQSGWSPLAIAYYMMATSTGVVLGRCTSILSYIDGRGVYSSPLVPLHLALYGLPHHTLIPSKLDVLVASSMHYPIVTVHEKTYRRYSDLEYGSELRLRQVHRASKYFEWRRAHILDVRSRRATVRSEIPSLKRHAPELVQHASSLDGFTPRSVSQGIASRSSFNRQRHLLSSQEYDFDTIDSFESLSDDFVRTWCRAVDSVKQAFDHVHNQYMDQWGSANDEFCAWSTDMYYAAQLSLGIA